MFSFLQQKGSMLDSRVEINNEVKKLTDAADTSVGLNTSVHSNVAVFSP